VNHNGQLDTALLMVEAAKGAGGGLCEVSGVLCG